MASVSRHRNGWNIRYVNIAGERKSFYPGPMTAKAVNTIRVHIEHLVAAQKSQTAVPDLTSSWVANCGLAMREKLVAHGLISRTPEQPKSVSLGDFTTAYIEGKADVKETTKTVWRRAQKLLIKYFRAGKALDSITLGDAKDFRHWLLREGRRLREGGLSENTARKMCSVASQFFSDAVDRTLIAVNPFTHKEIPRATRENRKRDHFVTRETVESVLSACPDSQWRLLFALSRFGGMRCPSEHLALKWEHIDWSNNRFTVTSPKTEHHEGKGTRVVPIFPELLPHLKAVWEESRNRTGYVITRYRKQNANLRSELLRILERAGVESWPKLFHNLRASRETELASEFPIHVVCQWIGNSPLVAQKHYLTVTESDFERAGNVRQFALHTMPETYETGQNVEERPKEKSSRKRLESSVSRRIEGKKSGRNRTRTTTKNIEDRRRFTRSTAKSTAFILNCYLGAH